MAEAIGTSILSNILEGFGNQMRRHAAVSEYKGKRMTFHLNNGEVVRGVFLGYGRFGIIVGKSRGKTQLPLQAISQVEVD